MAETTTKATPKKMATKPVVAAVKPVVAAAKPVVKKPLAKPTVASVKPVAIIKPTVAKSATAKPVAKGSKAMIVSDELRYRMVGEAAYYRAERNQFKSDPVRDWIEAEGDIATLLGSTK
ncbi:DUF2934 domain-containing protein [Propionivibrio sp.]|uniref:DUF2934 domain-containing protein n=1 Tax=Propionivibrio sp. TaxID=2212460 RepID=UPI003BF1AE70